MLTIMSCCSQLCPPCKREEEINRDKELLWNVRESGEY